MMKKKLTMLGLAGLLALATGTATAGDPLRVGVEGAILRSHGRRRTAL